MYSTFLEAMGAALAGPNFSFLGNCSLDRTEREGTNTFFGERTQEDWCPAQTIPKLRGVHVKRTRPDHWHTAASSY